MSEAGADNKVPVKPIIIIGTSPTGELMIVGPLHMKEYCISLMADAIKFAANVTASVPAEEKPSIIQVPPGTRVN